MRSAVLWGVLGMVGCSKAFGIGAPEEPETDAAPDGATFEDGSSSEAAPGDASSDTSADIPVSDARDAAPGEPRIDVSTADAGDARIDGSASEGGARDGVSVDAFGVDAPGVDAGRADALLVDASVDAVVDAAADADARCLPETDQAFCARLGKTCEIVNGTDNCGAVRNASCGTCSPGMGCVDRVCKTPVCTTFNYASAVFAPFSAMGTSEFAIATSARGESVVYAQSSAADCSAPVTYLADEINTGSRTYTSRSIAPWLDKNGITAQALSGDGLTLITLSTDFKTFQAAHRTAQHLIDFDAPSATDFNAVNGMLAGTTGYFRGGVISADGLEFFYSIFKVDPATDGLYSAKRSTTAVPFAVGARLTGIDPVYSDVTGVSSDRLTLFLFNSWAGYVFTRKSTSEPFSNPNAPNPPPALTGWHHKPLADCATLFATHNPAGNGCTNEDIVLQTRQ